MFAQTKHLNMEIRPRLRGAKLKNHKYFTSKESRVLIIGDLHCPFDLDKYLDHCIETYNNFNCNQVVFIGDLLDNHAGSYHESDPNGYGAGDELEFAIKRIKRWYKAFPNAVVTIGNHDRIVPRKMMTGGLPSQWNKSYAEVLNTPNWEFVTDYYIDDVRYTHGDKSGKPRTAAKRDMQSTVSGHYHTDMYCETYVGRKHRVFALAVGCGIDEKSYAMAYMQGGKKPAIGCGVVINGDYAINVPMNL